MQFLRSAGASLGPHGKSLSRWVRLGCTSLWQVSADSSRLIGNTAELDPCYIRNWGLRLAILVV